jgi:hypothetical protein
MVCFGPAVRKPIQFDTSTGRSFSKKKPQQQDTSVIRYFSRIAFGEKTPLQRDPSVRRHSLEQQGVPGRSRLSKENSSARRYFGGTTLAPKTRHSRRKTLRPLVED